MNFQVGGQVGWNSDAGHVCGTIRQKLHRHGRFVVETKNPP